MVDLFDLCDGKPRSDTVFSRPSHEVYASTWYASWVFRRISFYSIIVELQHMPSMLPQQAPVGLVVASTLMIENRFFTAISYESSIDMASWWSAWSFL